MAKSGIILEENPLCSITLPSNTTPEISGTYEKQPKIRFEDWLLQSGFPEDGEKLARCSLTVGHYQCSGGHDFYYRQFCGREYCPTCGKPGSFYHVRRTLRAAEHFIWSIPWGRVILTLPKHESESYLPKKTLAALQKAAWEVTRDNFGVEGAINIFHPLGKAENGLHIHFEVHFMITGTFNRGQVPAVVIENTKKAWALKLNELLNTKLQTSNVQYKFATQKNKKWHNLKYALRPVCTEDAMLKLSDEDKRYILWLKGFHRVKYFGCMANRKIHKWLRKHWAPVKIRNTPLIERKVCPICQQKMRRVGWHWVDEIPLSQVRKYNSNVWIDLAVDAFLRQEANKEGSWGS